MQNHKYLQYKQRPDNIFDLLQYRMFAFLITNLEYETEHTVYFKNMYNRIFKIFSYISEVINRETVKII